jgi:hypothetical protein
MKGNIHLLLASKAARYLMVRLERRKTVNGKRLSAMCRFSIRVPTMKKSLLTSSSKVDPLKMKER